MSEPGAPAAAGGIPLCVPELSGAEREFVNRCLDSGWVSSAGPFVGQFERDLAERVHAGEAVAVSTGTAAIQLALQAVGVGPEDEVLTSTLSFIAPANAVRYLGAWPVFVDAEPEFWQMDVRLVREFLAGCERDAGELRNPATGRRIAALLPVHILGHLCDLPALCALATEHGLPLVEDATEALGARFAGRHAGTMGDAGCYSFNGNKLITTGGGGMVVTDRPELAARVRYLSTQAKDDPIEYVHHEIGYNFRLTNLQSAMGCAQLLRLEEFVERKRAIAVRYEERLSDVPGIEFQPTRPDTDPAHWLFTVFVGEAYGADSRELLRRLTGQGIQTRPLWQPLHVSLAHRGAQVLRGATAERLNRHCLSLPCSVGLTEAEQDRVIDAIVEFHRERIG